MAYPVLYDVAYSYTGFQAAQGDNSFPGTELDADLAGLEDSIAAVLAFVEGAIRSDGKLTNGSVDFDQLSTGVKASIGSASDVSSLITTMNAQVASATTSATSAATNAAAAAASATSASNNASSATLSASTASTAATNASTSATNAATSAANAAATLANALTGPVSSTDKTAVRFSGTGGKTGQASALIIADTTAALSRVANGGVPVQGTNTNDNGAAGYVGEYLENNVTGAVNVATDTPTAIASIMLTPGDWDVNAGFTVFPNGNNTLTEIHCCLSNVNNGLTGFPFGAPHAMHVAFLDNQAAIMPTGVARWSVSVNTTVYAVVNLKYTTGGTMTATACIRARRAR
ncbi:hypothetical protein ACRQ5Q_24340 [Bradyrhizobium sp. PMVTL-01]|uniref:hypothetical protein n=1 Tax=Bradyrhizobium sp. PMVTL-01 TaxID=3434999 RepID=UPI003F712A37